MRTHTICSAVAVLSLLGCRDGGSALDSGSVSDTASSEDTGSTETGEDLSLPTCALLENGGAETGDISGWTSVEGAFEAVGASGSTPTPIEGDYQFFAGAAGRSVLSQTVDVSDRGALIDDEGWTVHLSAHVRNWSGDDRVLLNLQAFDEDGTLLDEQQEGAFTHSYYRERRVHLALPAGTREVQAQLIGERSAGNDNDAYFDQVELCLDEQPPPTQADLRRGPWLNWVTPDAISVLWETQGDVVGSVEYSTDQSFGDSEVETLSGDHHEVRLSGLDADTTYHYRVLSDGAPGEVYSFRTAPNQTVPFDFAVWGDNQDGPDVFLDVASRIAASPAEFALSVGDVVQDGDEGDYRNQLLDPLAAFASDRSFLVAMGNHELYGDSRAELFDLHTAQPGDEYCTGWSYGGAFFLFIHNIDDDSTQPVLDLAGGSAQLRCIEQQLASPEFTSADVQFALFHYPPRIEFWTWYFYDGASWYDGDDGVRDVLEPMFEDAGVDLVFNGHNHLYNYTPSGAYSSVAWVTTGGGGGGLENDGFRTATWDGIDVTHVEHHFLNVRVDGKTIDVVATRPDGSALHEFTVAAD